MTARLPFLLLAWLFLLTGPGYAQKNPYAMTFEVDLSNAIAKGFFNPASDNIDVAGNFNAWGNPANVLNPVGETGIYTFTTGQDFAPGYTFEFKFRINGDWANSQPGSNAEYTISEGVNLFSYTWQTPAIGWANLQWPQFIELERGEPLPDATLFGKIWIPDVTSNPEPVTGLQVWLGVNPENTDPATWDLPNQWFESSSYMQTGNDHEYSITLSGEMLPHFLPGTHYYVFRYRYGNDDYVYGAWGGPWDGVNNTSGELNLTGEIISASINPDAFIFGDFSDFDETGAFTTITWNDADFVQGVFILIEDEMVDFDFEVTEIDGATSTLHITLPEDDKKLQFPKNGDFTVSGVVEFNHGDNATFTITFTDPTWWVAIQVVDQGDQSNIANAEILIQETNQSYFTDNDGWADFTLPAGNYTLTITAEGYVAVENISLTVLGEFAENTLTVEMSPAQFTYQLLLEVSPELAGQVEGAGEYQEGEQVVLTATPAWGYYFVHWTLADQTVVSTNASFSYTMPAEDVTLIAHFSTFPAISEFPWLESFEAESFPPFGWQRMAMPGTIREWVSVTTQNNTPGGARSARHTYAPTSAGMQDGWLVTPPIEVPETGTSALSFWSKNAYTSYYHKNSVLISTGSSNPLSEDFTEVWSPGSVVNAWRETVINLDAYAGETIHIAFRYQGINAHEWYLDDVGITFIPDPDTYTLSLVAQPAEGGTVEGDGDYEEGYQVMVTATVAQGYEFVSWTDSEGTPLSTEASFLFTMPAEDVTLTANFLALPAPTFALTLEALPAAGGSLAGAGEYEEGEAVTLTATPNQGYAFVKWTDSEDNDISTAASFEFIMPGADITLIALFDFADATDHLTLSGLELYPNPSRGSFNIRSQALVLEIQMTDLTGKVIATSNVQDYEVDFSLQLDPGIYLIRVRTSEGVSVRKLQIQ
ncbi:MAG: InlB B-repeat-containing protein [Bacteroidales bacterium]